MRRPDPIRRALVTGASAGLGEEFARQLAERGVDLVLVARREGVLEELASELRAAAAVDVEVLAADLTDDAGLTRVEAVLADGERPVDLLVNNAGFGVYGPFVEQDANELARMLDLNCAALTRLAAAAMPGLRMRGSGGIINVGSLAGFMPGPGAAAYHASKAYVRSFSEALHEEARPHGVRVTLLAPGVTATEFQPRAGLSTDGLPAPLLADATSVVRAGLEGFTQGRAVVVPGALNRLAATSAGLGPSRVAATVAGAMNRWGKR